MAGEVGRSPLLHVPPSSCSGILIAQPSLSAVVVIICVLVLIRVRHDWWGATGAFVFLAQIIEPSQLHFSLLPCELRSFLQSETPQPPGAELAGNGCSIKPFEGV